MGTLSSHPPTCPYTSSIMRSLLAAILISVTLSLPSQLGRQNGYVAPVNTYIAAAPVTTYQPAAKASAAAPVAVAKTPVVGIRSQSFQPSGNGAFRYAFHTENDITASAEGSVKTVDDTEVV